MRGSRGPGLENEQLANNLHLSFFQEQLLHPNNLGSLVTAAVILMSRGRALPCVGQGSQIRFHVAHALWRTVVAELSAAGCKTAFRDGIRLPAAGAGVIIRQPSGTCRAGARARCAELLAENAHLVGLSGVGRTNLRRTGWRPPPPAVTAPPTAQR